MKPIQFIIFYLILVSCEDQDFLKDERDEELLFVFEVSRHGARSGLHQDYYNTNWLEGELTQLGARQHYLLGRQIRTKYIDEMKFLSPQYDPREIYIRSTCFNRTIESAYSQLLGIYPPSSNDQQLFQNQSESMHPPFNISSEVLNLVNKEIGMNALPFNFMPIPVHSYACEHDYFTPYGICPMFQETRSKREHDYTHLKFMNKKFKNAIGKFCFQHIIDKLGYILNMPPNEMKAEQAVKYIDSIWARYYEQHEISKDFTPEFLNDLMDLNLEYFNFSISMNENMRKAYLTGQISELVEIVTGIVEKDREGELSQKERTKFYFYSDHDDSIVQLSNAYEHQLKGYPPYASVAIYEVWRMKNGKYYINVTINDENVLLKQECGGKYQCTIEDFKDLAKRISFYGDQSGYSDLCGQNNEVFSLTYEEFEGRNTVYLEKEQNSLYQERRGKYYPEYSRFLIAYCLNLILAILLWNICKKCYYKNNT